MREGTDSMFPQNIEELNDRKAVFVINHSGGKDSQAMYLHVRRLVPLERLIVIHADLPEVDWEGIDEHIENTIESRNYYEVVSARKTFFEMVEHRKMWPSPDCRQCTSDLKRGPIEKAIRRYLKYRNLKLIVDCKGMRAEESPKRAKMNTFGYDKRNSKAGREWYTWLPIHEWTEDQVFYEIKDNLQKPHWAYGAGMTRLSCCFCIMSSVKDLKTAVRLKPKLFKKYCDMEKKIDHTFIMPTKKKGRLFLREILQE